MTYIKFIKKIILYSYIYNKEDYNDFNIIKDLILFNKTICRQKPLVILNKKNEIIGVKTELRKNNLNIFLNKLINFTLPHIKKNLSLNSDVFKLNNNIDFILRNKMYFFEYRTNISDNFNYTFNVRLIFDKNINYMQKLYYIDKILNINKKINENKQNKI